MRLAALSLLALAPCFLAPAPLAPLTPLRSAASGHERRASEAFPMGLGRLSAAPVLLAAAWAAAARGRARSGRATMRAWPWEEEDPRLGKKPL